MKAMVSCCDSEQLRLQPIVPRRKTDDASFAFVRAVKTSRGSPFKNRVTSIETPSSGRLSLAIATIKSRCVSKPPLMQATSEQALALLTRNKSTSIALADVSRGFIGFQVVYADNEC